MQLLSQSLKFPCSHVSLVSGLLWVPVEICHCCPGSSERDSANQMQMSAHGVKSSSQGFSHFSDLISIDCSASISTDMSVSNIKCLSLNPETRLNPGG